MQSRVDSPKNVKYTRVTKVYSRNQKNLPACKARAQHMAKHDTADQVGMPLHLATLLPACCAHQKKTVAADC